MEKPGKSQDPEISVITALRNVAKNRKVEQAAGNKNTVMTSLHNAANTTLHTLGIRLDTDIQRRDPETGGYGSMTVSARFPNQDQSTSAPRLETISPHNTQ